jgi:hypothetical protein
LKKAVPGYDLSTMAEENLPFPTEVSSSDSTETVEDSPEDVALKGFLFLAVDPERARRFAAETGLGRENLRAAAESPDILNGVLDYLAGNESLLLAFTENCGVALDNFERAHAALSAVAKK